MAGRLTDTRKPRRAASKKKSNDGDQGKARINIEVSPELRRQVKAKAAQQGTTIRRVVIEALENFVSRR